jgi:amidase
MVAIAHANDGGGSIRIPASCCGLVGLKPTRGRVPIGGDLNEISNFLIVEGVVTRTVRDTAGALDALSGVRHGGATQPGPPARPYRDEVGRDPGRLRIGILTHDPVDPTAHHPECVAAVESTARRLEALGHHVEVSYPPEWARPESLERFTAVWAADCAYEVDDWAEKVGREVTRADVEPLTWVLAAMGRKVTGPQFIATVADGLAASARAARWWRNDADPSSADGLDNGTGGFDLLLTPTLAEPPVPHGTFPSTPEHPLAGFARAGSFVPFTTQANVSGQPAISLPMHWTPDGLPVGVQLVAAFGREDLLIQVAAQLETAAPWADRSPPAAA